MFGDFFHTAVFVEGKRGEVVFVPMFGDPFFTVEIPDSYYLTGRAFSSPCLGILFSPGFVGNVERSIQMFSSPCLGILFSQVAERGAYVYHCRIVFVPMFGDSFFTAGLGCPTGWALYGPFAAGISN